MKNLTKQQTITIILGIALIACCGLLAYQNWQLKQKNTVLNTEIIAAHASTTQAIKEKADLVDALQEAADKNQNFANQLSQVNENLNRLEWINSLDAQLLQKYSKVYFLNENYSPAELSPIDTKFLATPGRTIEIHDRVLPFLQNMLKAAAAEDVTIQIASGYRSFETQSSLKADYKVRYGSGANAFSADQGYSEHQLATTIDVTSPQVKGQLVISFEKTKSFLWLKDNAYKYGFVLSYPANNSYYIYEPWHWRFVGIELATKLHDEGKYFYDLDQREIDSYLPNMFNN